MKKMRIKIMLIAKNAHKKMKKLRILIIQQEVLKKYGKITMIKSSINSENI